MYGASSKLDFTSGLRGAFFFDVDLWCDITLLVVNRGGYFVLHVNLLLLFGVVLTQVKKEW